MALSFNRRPMRGSGNEPNDSDDAYTSMGLPLFVEHLEQNPGTLLLDVGPASDKNINFFASRTKTLYVSDLFIPLDKNLSKKKDLDQVWKNIDYPPQTFDAIQLWTLCDYLDDDGLTALVERCKQLLKPGGEIMLVAQSNQPLSKLVRLLIINDDFLITWRPFPQLNLKFTHRHNHDIIDKFKSLSLVKSFIYRNGLREFLFRKSSTPQA